MQPVPAPSSNQRSFKIGPIVFIGPLPSAKRALLAIGLLALQMVSLNFGWVDRPRPGMAWALTSLVVATLILGLLFSWSRNRPDANGWILIGGFFLTMSCLNLIGFLQNEALNPWILPVMESIPEAMGAAAFLKIIRNRRGEFERFLFSEASAITLWVLLIGVFVYRHFEASLDTPPLSPKVVVVAGLATRLLIGQIVKRRLAG